MGRSIHLSVASATWLRRNARVQGISIVQAGNWWIPLTRDQSCGEIFHVMTIREWHPSPFSRMLSIFNRIPKLNKAYLITPSSPVSTVYRCIARYTMEQSAWGHYCDVIISVMASQITSLAIVKSIVYSGADQRKHQSSALLAFVRGIHRCTVNCPHKGSVTRKCLHLMTSSWPWRLECSWIPQ